MRGMIPGDRNVCPAVLSVFWDWIPAVIRDSPAALQRRVRGFLQAQHGMWAPASINRVSRIDGIRLLHGLCPGLMRSAEVAESLSEVWRGLRPDSSADAFAFHALLAPGMVVPGEPLLQLGPQHPLADIARWDGCPWGAEAHMAQALVAVLQASPQWGQALKAEADAWPTSPAAIFLQVLGDAAWAGACPWQGRGRRRLVLSRAARRQVSSSAQL